jgi:hypothetical protein
MIKSLDKIGVYGLEKQEAFDIIKDKCSDWDYNDLPIYRGSDLGYDNVLVNPSERLRTSANARFNIYTTLIDNSPLWKDYPKRSKSLICTLDIKKSKNYGKNYRVIPFDNSKWGVCEKSDIWFSFNNIKRIAFDEFYNMNEFNFKIFNLIPNDLRYHDFDKQDLILKSLIDTNKNNMNINVHVGDFVKYIQDNIDKYDNLYELLVDITDPNKNNFKLLEYNTLIGNYNKRDVEHEIWTDSSCILMAESSLIELFSKKKNESYLIKDFNTFINK